jgi:signal transduction histidine kinase/DNA-binding response OmpR family regulator
VFSFSVSADGTIWLSGIDELMKVSRDRTQTRIPVSEPFSYLMPSPGDNRNFIVGLKDGLLEVLPDGKRKPFGGEKEGFQNVSALIMARDGTFWMGTYNDGILHYDEAHGQVDRFGGGDIKSIVQDNEGYIWMSTATHITRYDPWSHVFSTLFDSHYRDGRFYDLLSAAKGPDGKLYFGGSGGITVVDPAAFRPAARQIPLRMESITVNDHSYPGNTEALDLDHEDNNLSIRIAGIDFQSGSLLDYEWMLDGYEDDWHAGSVTPAAVYTHIPPGSYTFRARVREQNADWSASAIALPVTIRPAPWASPWAKALYWLLGIALLLAALWAIIRMRTQKDRLALAAQREELKQQHIDFMTNISHEFRTPLSMIYAPAKELEKSALTPRNRELASLISRNAERLRSLSEQLLKNQGGRAESESLQVRQNDLAALVRSMTGMFRFAAEGKNLDLSVDLPESLLCWFDTEKVSKVFGNLMSNAVKYTPEGGHIRVLLERKDADAVISVVDDGIGVDPEKRERLFDRFDRLGAENTQVVGSGIGLNYARNLAVLHKGKLEYEPNEPKGSVFRFTLPVDESAYPDDISFTDREEPSELFAKPGDGDKAQTILIAEDNTEIRLFLNDLFRSDYNVFLASDGLEAEDDLKLSIPDLVLSDVIMPNKTGYGLCADIKANPDWNHIPVILLTAKADAESSIEGMKAGADAYVSKPFDPDVLKATVESILRNRWLLQEKIRDLKGADLENPAKTEEARLSPADSALLQKVQAYLDNNLENEEADINDMAFQIGMSYSSLYAKIKALTGVTPKAYATAYRMNIARDLLLQGWNVSETAYKVGSSSPSTFSREFKNHFGYPPSQVKAQ